MSQTDRMAFSYGLEESYGVFASGGEQMQTLLIESEDLTTDFQTIEDESVTGDAQLADLVRVGRLSQGTINFRLGYGHLDELLPGVMRGAWSTDVLENGVLLPTYAFEKNFQDVSQFYAFRGCGLTSLSLSFARRQQIRGSLGVLGKGGVFAGTSIGTGAAAAALANPMFVTGSTLSIEEGGVGVTCPTAFSFNVQNELAEKICLGEDDATALLPRLFRVTGTIEAYFDDTSMISKLIADTPSDFEIVTEDSDGNAYSWIFPQFKFTGLRGPANTGRSGDVMKTLEWTAYRDPSTTKTMRVERQAA